MKNNIQEISNRIEQELIDIRRHLHKHPELSFNEKETGQYIQSLLNKWNIDFTGNWAEHGVVAILKGSKDHTNSKVIALRADIDALPILEENDIEYKSTVPGIMHACGHDVHTTCLLGALKILEESKAQWSGTIKAIFQPAEEKLPGGASILIREGVLKNPNPEAIIGQHVHPALKVGTVGFCPGIHMASTDEIYIEIQGVGGHAAMPHKCIDPIVASAQIILNLQTQISRFLNPLSHGVLTIGKINSDGGATNIIPERVFMEGTLRMMDEGDREKAHTIMKQIVQGTADSAGVKAKLEIRKGYPCLKNNVEKTTFFKQSAIEYLGEENVFDIPPRMTAEDFAFYSQKIPACFYRLGVSNTEKGITSGVHTPTFNVDEACIKLGAGLMAFNAYKYLSS